MPPEEAAKRVRRLVEAGYREVVLCGIHLGLYGADLERGADLAGLLERLLAVPGLGRVRLSSIEPMEVGVRLLELMAAEPRRVCPHLHLPLQSGDDGVLRRMNRPYGRSEFLEAVSRVREALADPAITTDLLVGFPGETRAAFENTLSACREAAFSRVHVFPFSPRPGTPAAAMDGQVPRDVIRARRARAGKLGEALAAEYRSGLVGREARIVLECLDEDGSAEGLAERYVRVRVAGPVPRGWRRREMVAVTPPCVGPGGLEARAGRKR